MENLEPGLEATRQLVVSEDDTAEAVGSGDVPVLATPRVLALAEETSIAAITEALPEGQTSLGTYAEVEHDAPSAVGAEIQVKARLVERGDRHLTFDVEVRQDGEVVARVQHRRMLVDRADFLARLQG